eukprot:PhM_4_TR14110/c1_g1_i1/m.43054
MDKEKDSISIHSSTGNVASTDESESARSLTEFSVLAGAPCPTNASTSTTSSTSIQHSSNGTAAVPWRPTPPHYPQPPSPETRFSDTASSTNSLPRVRGGGGGGSTGTQSSILNSNSRSNNHNNVGMQKVTHSPPGAYGHSDDGDDDNDVTDHAEDDSLNPRSPFFKTVSEIANSHARELASSNVFVTRRWARTLPRLYVIALAVLTLVDAEYTLAASLLCAVSVMASLVALALHVRSSRPVMCHLSEVTSLLALVCAAVWGRADGDTQREVLWAISTLVVWTTPRVLILCVMLPMLSIGVGFASSNVTAAEGTLLALGVFLAMVCTWAGLATPVAYISGAQRNGVIATVSRDHHHHHNHHHATSRSPGSPPLDDPLDDSPQQIEIVLPDGTSSIGNPMMVVSSSTLDDLSSSGANIGHHPSRRRDMSSSFSDASILANHNNNNMRRTSSDSTRRESHQSKTTFSHSGNILDAPTVVSMDSRDSPRANSLISLGTTVSTTSSRSAINLREVFAANVSDELRGSLSALFGLLDAMRHDEHEREAQENWRNLTRIADTMLLVVDNLIDIAKLAVDPNRSLTSHPSSCDVEHTVREVVTHFNDQMVCRRVRMIPTLDVRLCGTGAVLMDRQRVRQFLFNIFMEIVRSNVSDLTLFLDVRPESLQSMKVHFTLSVESLQELPPFDLLRRCVMGRPVNRMNVTVAVAGVKSCGGDIVFASSETMHITAHCVLVCSDVDRYEGANAKIMASALEESTHTIAFYLHQLGISTKSIEDFRDVNFSPHSATTTTTAVHQTPKKPSAGKTFLFTGASHMPPEPVLDHENSNIVLVVVAEGHEFGTLKPRFGQLQHELPWPFYPTDLMNCIRQHARCSSTVGTPRSQSLSSSMASSGVYQGVTLRPLTTPTAKGSGMFVSHDLHLLLVEDNNVVNRVTTRKLALVFRDVTSVSSGEDAVEKVRTSPRNTFDVIIMDLEMPGISGVEATRRIRALEAELDLDRILIVACTANACGIDTEHCLGHGMDSYLTKPLIVDQFMDVLREKRLI